MARYVPHDLRLLSFDPPHRTGGSAHFTAVGTEAPRVAMVCSRSELKGQSRWLPRWGRLVQGAQGTSRGSFAVALTLELAAQGGLLHFFLQWPHTPPPTPMALG